MEKAKIEQSYGLHHTPFTLMWMSILPVSMGIMFAIALVLCGLRDPLPFLDNTIRWLERDTLWLLCMLISFGLGIPTSIAQVWLLRQRYGFVPRWWHVMTIVGWTLAGLAFFVATKQSYYDRENFVTSIMFFLWFVAAPFFQTIALWSHLRKGALLWLLAGIAAGIIAAMTSYTSPRYDNFFFALLAGTLAQPLFTALALIFLMARQRTLNINTEALAVE